MAGYKIFNSWGLGFYVNNSPSVCDPAGIYRWIVVVQFGPWIHQWRIK